MDRLTHFVELAHLKLRVLFYARHPEILENILMDKRPSLYIPRPVELAGMRSRLQRSQAQGKALAATGTAYDAVMDGIDEAHGAIKGHVGDLTLLEGSLRNQIMSMLERSNGDPTGGESDGRQSSSGDATTSDAKTDIKTDITAVATPALSEEATKAAIVVDGAADPMPTLTPNGATQA